MIKKTIFIVGTLSKVYAVGKTGVEIYKVVKKIQGGKKALDTAKEKTTGLMKTVKSIGTMTQVASNATEIVSDISKGTAMFKSSGSEENTKATAKKTTTTKPKTTTGKKKNR